MTTPGELYRVLGGAPYRSEFGPEFGRRGAVAAGAGRHGREAGHQCLRRPAQGPVVLPGDPRVEVARVGQTGLGGHFQLPCQRGHGGLRERLVLAAAHGLTYEADAEADAEAEALSVGASAGGSPDGGVPPSPPPPLPAPVFSASGSMPRVREPL